jgi:hypothetical protein
MTDPMPGNRQAIVTYQDPGVLTRLVGALDFRAAKGSPFPTDLRCAQIPSTLKSEPIL